MILDKVFYGVLDQGRGCLLVYEKPEADVRLIIRSFSFFLTSFFGCHNIIQNTYGAAIETLAQVGKVVESLYAKVSRPFSLLLLCEDIIADCSLFSSFRLSRLHEVYLVVCQ